MECLRIIEDYLTARDLRLSPKKTYIAPLSDGIRFLGFRYRLTETGFVTMSLDKKKLPKERRKIRRQMPHLPKQKMDFAYQSWKANATQGTTWAAVRRMDSYYYIERRRHYA